MKNTGKENFELAMLDDYVVLYTGSRTDRNTVPENLFCYDVRHDDDCQGIACEVKPHVLVNHWGTILSKTEIPMTEGGSYYPREDMNYLGETLTVEEYMRLNTGRYGEELSDMPHEKREDLALFYGIRVPAEKNRTGIAAIHNSQMEQWRISEEQLKKDAWANMRKQFPAVFQYIEDVICRSQEVIPLEPGELDREVTDRSMFVLSNRENVQGAVYMFDENILKKIAEKLNSSLIILPSSIHETIIMRETESMNMNFMRNMVTDVNEMVVESELWLSDEVYRYDRDIHTLSLVKPAQPEEVIVAVQDEGMSQGMM